MKTFPLTPSEFRKRVGVSQQRISQYIQNHRLKEGVHYQKVGKKFYMYNELAVKEIGRNKRTQDGV